MKARVNSTKRAPPTLQLLSRVCYSGNILAFKLRGLSVCTSAHPISSPKKILLKPSKTITAANLFAPNFLQVLEVPFFMDQHHLVSRTLWSLWSLRIALWSLQRVERVDFGSREHDEHQDVGCHEGCRVSRTFWQTA